jgi:outer membrane protein OmpA-like peptidoglycan-associated protein
MNSAFTTRGALLGAAILFFSPTSQAQQFFDSLTLIRVDTVYFDFGKHDIRPDADSTLRKLTDTFKSVKTVSVRIEAHTDSIGNIDNNEALSQRRAAAVRDCMIAWGLPPERLEIAAFGKRRPIAANRDETGRQMNRRATIEVRRPMKWARWQGRTLDKDSEEGLPARIVLRSPFGVDTLAAGSDGTYEMVAPALLPLNVEIIMPGYFFESKTLRFEPGRQADLSAALTPARPGAMVDIQNLYFVGNQAVLLPQSQPELDKVLAFARLNDRLILEIAGHINGPNRPPVSEDSWDFQLSVRRAKLVYDHLIANDIPAERISYKGYGNSQMRFPHATQERQMAANRRVEIRVLKEK